MPTMSVVRVIKTAGGTSPTPATYRTHFDQLATGDEHKKARGSAGGNEVIAHLLAIELDLSSSRSEFDNPERKMGTSVGHPALVM